MTDPIPSIPPLKIPLHKGFNVRGTRTGRLSSGFSECPADPSAVDKLAAQIDPEIAKRVRQREADIKHWRRIGHVTAKMSVEMADEIDAEILGDLKARVIDA